MPRAVVSWVAAGALLVPAVLAGACGGSDGGGSGDGGSGGEAEVAATVCGLLRDWNNDLSAVINTASQEITDADDPATANDVLLTAFDEMIARAEDHLAQAGDLELPEVAGGSRVASDLRSGAEQSLAVLRDERAEAAELPPIEVDDQGGALGGAFVAVERATSVLEPRVGAYDEDLRRAFAADESCAHVIAPG